MNLFIATRDKINETSQKFTVSGATETDTLMLGIRDGDTIYVTDLGPAGQDDVEDEKRASQHDAIYWSTDFAQVITQLRLPKNTKGRAQEILTAAHDVLAEQNVDITEGVQILPLAKILEGRVNCHRDTAKKAIGKAVRQKRGQLVAQWGGAREGAGYPKGQPRKPKV